jgi:MoxR-like ATPase
VTSGRRRPDPVGEIVQSLEAASYIADPSIGTALFMAQQLGRPLLIEGRAGVGKTEIAKVMAEILQARLIRLQCYEGLDVNTSLYEWNYPRQLLHIKLEEGTGKASRDREREIFGREFLLERPLLAALSERERAPVLLIDEIDRADEEFEAFLLEILSDYQATIPELGTIKAVHIPLVILTSNRTRELSDALRRRCLYLWIDYPEFDKELRIVRAKVPGIGERLAGQVVRFVEDVRGLDLEKSPGVSETLDWARAMMIMSYESINREAVEVTVGALLKDADDLEEFRSGALDRILARV